MRPRIAQPFDNRFDPIGLWGFYENPADASGNGFDLTVQTGTARYTPMAPGLGGVLLDGSTCLYHDVTATLLARTLDMTIEVMVRLDPLTPAEGIIAGYSTALGGTSATNWLYSIGAGTTATQYRWLQHSGANTASARNITDRSNHPDVPVLLAATRFAGVVQLYINGRGYGGASSALVNPTDGANSRFRVGGGTDVGNRIVGVVGGVKVIARALTSDEVKEDYNRTLGRAWGYAA